MSTDIPFVPIVHKKKKPEEPKKKVSWWKRVLGFVLGVFQICVGALIVASTCGAAAGFGSFMIQDGITDCFKALFSPQVFDNLK